MTSLIATIEHKRFAISHQEIREGMLSFLRDHGLNCVALCDYGSKRSVEAAKIATQKNIPSVYLIGGLSGILDNLHHPQYEHLIRELNKVPELAVILWKHELRRYEQIFNNIKYTHYETVDHFSDSLPRHYH